MLNLNGVIAVELIRELADYTKLRFKNPNLFKCAEALGMYEQNLMSKDKIFDICQKAMEHDLYEPVISYVPPKIVNHFASTRRNKSKVIPVSYSPQRSTIVIAYLDELGNEFIPIEGYKFECVPTPIYYYFEKYVQVFGIHEELNVVPAKVLFDSIVREAISLDAMDITIVTRGKMAKTFYNVRKKKRYSNRIITQDNMADIIKMLCMKSPLLNSTNRPKYVGVDLNDDYRGRVVINRTFEGHAITIRTLPNFAFERSIEDCNMSPQTNKFVRRDMMNHELGLRIIVGSTASGKNTTNLAILHEMVQDDTKKVVSVEMPVEQTLEGVIQINCENEEEFSENVSSLLRQNPDIVYITEIGDNNANEVMTLANTGKIVFSTLHANGCSDVIGRLTDITKLSVDKIIQVLHSIVYQELVRDEEHDTIAPKNRYIYLSSERKLKLYGKPYGEVIKLMKEWEGGDIW